MNLFTNPPPRPAAPALPPPHLIEIVEPEPEDCEQETSLPPEGNVKLRNYRMLTDNIRAYTPTGDIHTSPTKKKLVSRFDVSSTISPPRTKILELLRPGDPGRDALEAIVRPAPRRGLTRPLDEDTKRFLQRALLSPSPCLMSAAATPEPHGERPEPESRPSTRLHVDRSDHPRVSENRDGSDTRSDNAERSLAEELREAEEDERCGSSSRRELLREFRKRGGGVGEAAERERLGRLALSVEEDGEGGAGGAGGDECSESRGGLWAAARRIDALLEESRSLHEELAGIHEDIQRSMWRAGRCAAGARALDADTRALRYLDDVVALLRGDVAGARRARSWPFALGARQPDRNYVI